MQKSECPRSNVINPFQLPFFAMIVKQLVSRLPSEQVAAAQFNEIQHIWHISLELLIKNVQFSVIKKSFLFKNGFQ